METNRPEQPSSPPVETKGNTLTALEEEKVRLLQEQEESGNNIQFLIFQSSDGFYGINILQAHEVLKPVEVTRLPNVEEEVLGVINLRGSIIPVIDINKKFGYNYSGLTDLSRIVVCTFGSRMMGILVDRVLEVARISEEDIEAVEVSDLSNQYINGVGRSTDRIFLILNPSSVFVQVEE